MGRNYYELLGVSEDASVDEIRVAYRAAMLRNHPDLHEGGGSGKDSRNLNLAYETLASAIKRAQYDDRLRRHRTQQSERRNAESSNPHSQSSTPEDDTGFANLFHRNRLVFVSSAAGLLLFFGWVLLLLVDPFSFFVVETASQPAAESASEVDSFDSNNNGANKKAGKQTAEALIQAETTEITPTVLADDLPESPTLPPEDSEDSSLPASGQETEPRPSESIAATENSSEVDSNQSVTDGMEKAPESFSNKQRIPNKVDIAAAEEKIRLVFGDRYDSGNSREQKINLAQELLEVGMETNDDIAARYVLYQSASRIAVSTAAAPLYRRIVGALTNEFEIEEMDLLMAGYAAMIESPDAATKTSELLSVITKDIFRYRALDQLSNAKSLCDIGLNVARDTPDEQDLMALSDFIIWQMGKKTEAANALATVASLSKIQSAPEIAKADLIVAGRYRCFSQGNWRVGLPLLANALDQRLSNLARLEITEGESAASKIGNAWWDYSNTDSLSAYEKARIQHHASEWLKLAVDDLSGLDKMLAEKRLRDSVANTDEISSYVKLAIEFDGAQRPAIGVVQSPPLPAVAPFNSAKAKEHQEVWAKYLGVEVESENSIGMKFRVIPAGTFAMGENDDAHAVTLTKPFMLGTYEVTQGQYQRVMGTNPSKFKGANNPVENVSWDDAVEFCRKLSELSAEKAAGNVYRLPTEAQWEYACRAGTTTEYSFGDDDSDLGDYAWFRENSSNETHPVGDKLPNAWGLYDMHGNVVEWCQDLYGDYPSGSVTDPTGPASGSSRVFRGGCWNSAAEVCRSADRYGRYPSLRSYFYGFRVSLSPSGK